MKYSAINIGPIIQTLSLARRPRELWAASYLFSYLMECIINQLPEQCEIIAPVKGNENNMYVGLYPDRLYFSHKGEVSLTDICEKTWDKFCEELFNGASDEFKDYFNMMHISLDLKTDKYPIAIAKLNSCLDILELCAVAHNPRGSINVTENIYSFISKRKDSPLVRVSQDSDRMPMETLAEVAACQLQVLGEDKWKEFEKNNRDESFVGDPYSLYKSYEEYKSYHRYFCVVQADGDNMGKTVTSDILSNDELRSISEMLWNYGIEASELINKFGGKAIYAGGDDLLFLAPVVGKDGRNIFGLLDSVAQIFDSVINNLPETIRGNELKTPSLSFGVSICYYKYPLYEALESARNLLFNVAKKGTVKNKIAWSLVKHSGEVFNACYSKFNENLHNTFKEILTYKVDGDIVSIAAHKLKMNWALLEKCLGADKGNKKHYRLDSFFATILGAQRDDNYLNSVKKLIIELDSASDIKDLSSVLYAMMRTAKFINGEDTKDE